MDSNNMIDLIKRNVSEIVGEDKLKKHLKGNKKIVAYCGYEPSGPLHLGHFVTLMKLSDLEKAGIKTKILLADIHAMLNRKGASKEIEMEIKNWKKAFKALGLKSEVVLGSDFQFKKDYQSDVMDISQKITINRGLRSMQEIARDIKNATVSQLWYPLMQVVDIKYLKVDIAVGGLEQRKVHMVGKDLSKYVGWDFVALHTPLIDSLKKPGEKMSSSIKDSLISFTDSKKEIESKIMRAYCPSGKVEGNSILQILKLIVFPKINSLEIKRPEKFGGGTSYRSYEEVEKDFKSGKLHPLDLKKTVSQELENLIEPIRKKIN